MLLLIRYHSLPQEKMYWSLDKDISVPIVWESMSCLQYRNMKQNLHLADNSQIDNTNKLYNERPYLNLLNTKLQQFGIFLPDLSIDEQMIPYRGKHSSKMFFKVKPIRLGLLHHPMDTCSTLIFIQVNLQIQNHQITKISVLVDLLYWICCLLLKPC